MGLDWGSSITYASQEFFKNELSNGGDVVQVTVLFQFNQME